MKRLWVFYYTTTAKQYEQIEVTRKQFIKPERSKVWKTLQKKLGIGNDVHQVGYVLAENFETNM